ncbi:hypothetical protein Taro_049447 [Colocasia esculenta]|uniref:Selenoprotein F n=1 Tax=Colocasia esculenta TaxID=4460 RepID=A0A843XB45_COLES|nr:hypothetical protein [Colocasia esculenta]
MERLLPLALLVLLPGAFGEQLSTRECEDLGFTGLALCSDCTAFAEYVKNEELVSDCRKCCTEDSDDSMSKVIYAGAILEVCMRKLVFYPETVAFIEEEKDKFPAVRVQYVYASPPKLVMLDDDGHHQETIRGRKEDDDTNLGRRRATPSSALHLKPLAAAARAAAPSFAAEEPLAPPLLRPHVGHHRHHRPSPPPPPLPPTNQPALPTKPSRAKKTTSCSSPSSHPQPGVETRLVESSETREEGRVQHQPW